MVLLSDRDLANLKSDINDIITDTSINTVIKYRQFVDEDYFTPREQMTSQSRYNDWSGVSAVRGLVTLSEVNRIGGIEVGMTKFVLMRSSVSGTISTTDLIVDSGTTYDIIKSGYDQLDISIICYTNSQ